MMADSRVAASTKNKERRTKNSRAAASYFNGIRMVDSWRLGVFA